MARPGNLWALVEESCDAVECFSSFSSNVRKTILTYSKAWNRKIKKAGAFVEPPLAMPVPPTSIRGSMSTSVAPNETVETPPGSKPGKRPARGAALRARQGVNENYNFMSQTKLRRPSNFNASRGFQPMPTIIATPQCSDGSGSSRSAAPSAQVASSDEAIFLIPALPLAINRSSRKNRPTNSDDTDSESLVIGESRRATRASKRKYTKKESQRAGSSKMAKQETDPVEPKDATDIPETVDTILGEPLAESKSNSTVVHPEANTDAVQRIETTSGGTRTKTILKNKPETAFDSTIVLQEANTDAVEHTSNRTRTKTVQKKKSETASNSTVVLPEAKTDAGELSEASDRTRTKTVRKNKAETTTNSTIVLPEASTDDDTTSSRTRTKTIRKDKTETAANSTIVLPNANTIAVEQNDTTSNRTRTKTIRKNKTETESISMVVVPEPNAEAVEHSEATSSKTRTKTIRKNKPVEENAKPEEPLRDFGNPADNDEGPEGSRQAEALPTNTTVVLPTKAVSVPDDPMDTLDLPEGMEYLTIGGAKKRSHDANHCEDLPGVKRLKSSETTVDDLVCQDAPRTRSKMRAMELTRSRSEETVRTPGQGKENSRAAVNFILQTFSAGVKTPLAPVNKSLVSPKGKATGSAPRSAYARFVKDTSKDVEKAKMAEARRKEEEALRKKQELMKLKQEEIRNQRETKLKKVTESRAAVEKEKLLQLEKEKKERDEKMKAARAEMLKQKEEERLKKKKLNQLKAQEAEERRLKDEQLRLAKLREQEEEQRKAAEARQRQEEEAERLAALRKQQQKEEEQARLLEKSKEKQKVKAAKDDSDDYGILDDEDSEEAPSKRPVPKWAEKSARIARLRIQAQVSPALVRTFFNVEPLPPNLRDIFGREALIRPRTSSAVWATPPPPPSSSS